MTRAVLPESALATGRVAAPRAAGDGSGGSQTGRRLLTPPGVTGGVVRVRGARTTPTPATRAPRLRRSVPPTKRSAVPLRRTSVPRPSWSRKKVSGRSAPLHGVPGWATPEARDDSHPEQLRAPLPRAGAAHLGGSLAGAWTDSYDPPSTGGGSVRTVRAGYEGPQPTADSAGVRASSPSSASVGGTAPARATVARAEASAVRAM